MKKNYFNLDVLKLGTIVVFEWNHQWCIGKITEAESERLVVCGNVIGSNDASKDYTLTPETNIQEVVLEGKRFFGTILLSKDVFDISPMKIGDFLTYKAFGLSFTGKIVGVSPEEICVKRYCSSSGIIVVSYLHPTSIEILHVWKQY